MQIAKSFPNSPGVYIFKHQGKVVYVGKAKALRKRVLSYFGKHASQKQKEIVSYSDELGYMIFSNEREALVCEANLIYSYKPRFNVLLKDVRAYPYLNFVGEKYPYVEISYERKEESLGPFTSVRFLRTLLDIIQPFVKLRTCRMELSKVKRPCFEFHLKRCSAPCVGAVSVEEYKKQVELAKSFFEGDIDLFKARLKDKIESYASRKMFEEAQRLKEVYKKMNDFLASQSAEFSHDRNLDAFEIGSGIALLIKVRNGMILTKLEFEFDGSRADFLKYYYLGRSQGVPAKVLVSEKFRGMKSWSKRLKTEVTLPQDDVDKAIMKVVRDNFIDFRDSTRRYLDALKNMKEKLGLSKTPVLIEGIDISHTAGTLTVASVVSFSHGRPVKNLYRKYRLSNFSRPDDFEAMKQVVRRRYSKHPLPDLLLVDGGKGQVEAVRKALKEMNLSVDIVGLAKKDERLILKNGDELHLSFDDLSLRILINVRDESHRFATSYHYLLRNKNMLSSRLDDLKGIGPKRKKALLTRFKSLNGIKEASFEELKEVVGEKIAKKLKEFLTRQGSIS